MSGGNQIRTESIRFAGTLKSRALITASHLGIPARTDYFVLGVAIDLLPNPVTTAVTVEIVNSVTLSADKRSIEGVKGTSSQPVFALATSKVALRYRNPNARQFLCTGADTSMDVLLHLHAGDGSATIAYTGVVQVVFTGAKVHTIPP